ncbi:serine hydrolase domain-containing protein [Chelatococcus sp. SYSU_G07232]|uniref:Serine hydrolase domain-containing protein n=1 Tax=Chelatococcus albus TaxID=3047466 RepID=A0ABT7AJB0_9HYPH|nr:serine hydrolase domain-containing protein [Chelatococcus sp. SYSU_G07232]MDJ1159082.1 serine hydrolase domain-containing protein [Chelatococcus sp. SYSU_G07232]
MHRSAGTAMRLAPQPCPRLARLVGDFAADHDLPAAAAAVVSPGGIEAAAAVGVRRLGGQAPVSLADRWHLGSIGKSVTALMLARLVDRGTLDWTTTVGAALPGLVAETRSSFAGVTLEQLLTHRSGMRANPGFATLMSMLWWPDSTDPGRLRMVRQGLSSKPRTRPGTHFDYSNLGYVVAGAMAEAVTGESWETLVLTEVLGPLGLRETGFGPPGLDAPANQPWGHRRTILGRLRGRRFRPVAPSGRFADNPPALGPAGVLHMSLGDFARYAGVHLAALSGRSTFLRPATAARLYTPPATEENLIGEGHDYACGWVVSTPDTGFGCTSSRWHDGSNTLWYAALTLVPEQGRAFVFAANAFDPAAIGDAFAMHERLGRLFRRWAGALPPTARPEPDRP